MKVTISSKPDQRKLVAVVEAGGKGLFLQTSQGIKLLKESGTLCNDEYIFTLQERLRIDPNRKPVYEGDTVTIQF